MRTLPLASAETKSHAIPTVRVTNGHVVTAGSFILLLPNILFALHLKPVAALIMLAGTLAYAALTLTRHRLPSTADSILARPLEPRRFGICLVVALALLVLGGEGHLMFANWDWLWRDAVLSDLARAPFPPTYEVSGQTFFLRAPLGMYMLPALVAHITNLGLSDVALLVQNTALLTVVLYTLAAISGRRAALTMLVFLSFSGIDIVGQVLMWVAQGRSLSAFVLPSHIESWIGLQYSSTITQLFWVPNHALPSYWLAMLAMLCAKRELSVGTLGMALAASLLWSPFAFIGTLPLAVYLVLRDARHTLVSPAFWLAAGTALCFLPVAFYLQVDAAQVPHEFVLFRPFMAFTIALFLIIEIPHLAVIRPLWSRLDPTLKGLLVVSILVLLVLPTMRLGLSNDLVMRASIPALMLLAYAFAEALSIARDGHPNLLRAGIVLALIGAVTPAQELTRALIFPRYAISACNILTVWKKLSIDQPRLDNYLARDSLLPGWLMASGQGAPLANRPETTCWPDLPYDPRSRITVLSNDMLLHLQDHGKTPPL